MRQKVSYKMFFWVFGLVLSVLTSLLGYMTFKIDSIQQTTYSTGKDIAEIQGIFKNNTVTFEK